MSITLAQRLNDLAQANADNLLSDDEYRLLRQSAFEQYSGNVAPPLENPIVPTKPTRHDGPHGSPSTSRTKRSAEPPKDSNLNKLSVTNLIRRATGRNNAPSSPRDQPTPISPHPDAKRSRSPISTKLGILPRLFNRKSELPPLRTLSGMKSNPNMQSEPSASSSSGRRPITPFPTSPAPTKVTQSSGTPVTLKSSVDERTLVTSAEIREAIVTLDEELRGLIDAFNALEHGALRRIKKQNARRLPTNTPANVDVLLEGREWREHRIVPSPSAPTFEPRGPQRIHLPLESFNDSLSLHSSHSDRTNFSQSRSGNSVPQRVSPGSPLSPHFRGPSYSLSRKRSVSSVSSRSNSFLSSSRLGVFSSTSRLSNSSTNLPLHVPKPLSSAEDHTDLDGLEGLDDESDQLTELHEIQQRRNEVITRYNQRIDYLKAKQKGAELHERLVRK